MAGTGSRRILSLQPTASTLALSSSRTIEREDLSAGVHDIYDSLRAQGCEVEGDHLLLKNFPVQFLAAHGLTEEAVQKANNFEYQGVRAKVFRPEYMIAIAASVRRPKDIARIKLLMEQADIDRHLLDTILKRHKLSLP